MIDAFEILRNSDFSDYHNGTTMNFETGGERRWKPSKTAKRWPFWCDAARGCGVRVSRGATSKGLQ
jgi:hypothetical protein